MTSRKALAVGIDFGCTSFITLSSGQAYVYPKTLKKMRREISKVSGEIRSKEAIGSKGKLRKKLQQLRATFARLQEEFLDGLVLKLVKAFHFFFLEDVNKDALMRSRTSIPSVSHMPWKKFIDKLKAECKLREKVVVMVPAINTSRKCSDCGNIKFGLRLSDRVYQCEKCGLQMGRDDNACKNILNHGWELLNGKKEVRTKPRSSKRKYA